MTTTKQPPQHHKPCATCPFSRKVPPDLSPGGSPLAVYVAQHFLPFQVPCHECVDYSDEDWKRSADNVAQCVGFAQCRDGAGLTTSMPQGLLKEAFNTQHKTFEDIWDFYAYHAQVTREQALLILRPSELVFMLAAELDREGFRIYAGPGESKQLKDRLLRQAVQNSVVAWDRVAGDVAQATISFAGMKSHGGEEDAQT